MSTMKAAGERTDYVPGTDPEHAVLGRPDSPFTQAAGLTPMELG